MVNGEEEEVHRPSSLEPEGSAMAKGLLLRCALAAAWGRRAELEGEATARACRRTSVRREWREQERELRDGRASVETAGDRARSARCAAAAAAVESGWGLGRSE